MLHGWENFYFMLGSAAAGLIGLLFVVVSLTSGGDQDRAERGARLYLSPTVLHFVAVLVISAAAIAPGLPRTPSAVGLGLIGLYGGANAIRATVGIAKARRGADPPHWSDTWHYGVWPAAAYLGLGAVAVGLAAKAALAPYGLAAAVLALLLLGIRNAWDLVTWLAPRRTGA